MPTVELQEWQETIQSNIHLSASDRRLVKTLQGIEIRELTDGIYIRSSSWIGVVRFDSFVVRICPKLKNIDVMRMLIIAGGFDRLRRHRATREYELESNEVSLLDLIALLLTDSCTLIAKEGLLRGYVTEEDDLPVMRGRLRISDQIRRRYGRIDRLECRYDDHHADIVENQILHTALALCRRYVQHPLARSRVQSLLDTFAAVSGKLHQDWRNVRTEITYNRLNARYREAHELAWIVLSGLNVRDLLAMGGTNGFAFLLDMNPLFEKFIEVLVRSVLRDEAITVHSQLTATGHIWDAEQQQTYKRLRPDLLVTTQDHVHLPIDAKYKRYDQKKLHEGDIYQAFLYTYAFKNPNKESPPSALLIYPTDTSATQLSCLHIRDGHSNVHAQLHVLGIDIPTMLDHLFDTGSASAYGGPDDIRCAIDCLLP